MTGNHKRTENARRYRTGLAGKNVLLVLGLLVALLAGQVSSVRAQSRAFQVLRSSKPTAFSGRIREASATTAADVSKSTVPPGRALLMSFAIPGWGQHALGHRRSSAFFLATEALLWLSAGTFSTLSGWKENDYRLYAVTHAGVKPEGKDKQFFVNVGNYDSLEDYNQAKLRGRNLRDYYRDRDAYFWQWDSPANRMFYENLRVTSDRYANRAELMLGGVLANHLISGLHALWLARRQEHLADRRQVDWHAQIFPYPAVQVTARF